MKIWSARNYFVSQCKKSIDELLVFADPSWFTKTFSNKIALIQFIIGQKWLFTFFSVFWFMMMNLHKREENSSKWKRKPQYQMPTSISGLFWKLHMVIFFNGESRQISFQELITKKKYDSIFFRGFVTFFVNWP